MEPTNTSYSLNYMHALELDQQYNDVVQEVSRFCSQTDLALGGRLNSASAVKVGDGNMEASKSDNIPLISYL